LRFVLSKPDLGLWDRNMKFVVEPGTFRVMIGSSSEDIRLKGEFEIVPRARAFSTVRGSRWPTHSSGDMGK